MKCLVTGSRGFIGSYLVKALEERGDEVIELHHESFHKTTPEITALIPEDIDYIFALHAYGNMSNQKGDAKIFNANLSSTMKLLEATKDVPYKAFINVSSSSVLLPHQTMYSATKLGAEALCRAFVDEYDKPIVTVRPFSVYGPKEADFRFIPTVFRSCLTGEEMDLDPYAVHDWVYIDDLVRIVIGTADLKMNGGVVNIGTGRETRNQDIISMVSDITGKHPKIGKRHKMRSYDNQEWVNDGQLGKHIPLKEGLEKCYKYYKERYVK